jgi:hypothetical protein
MNTTLDRNETLINNNGTFATSTGTWIIEKGIPLPPQKFGRGAPRKYPFHVMQVGDSVYVPGTKCPSPGACAKGKFATRKVDGGYRVWRTG